MWVAYLYRFAWCFADLCEGLRIGGFSNFGVFLGFMLVLAGCVAFGLRRLLCILLFRFLWVCLFY